MHAGPVKSERNGIRARLGSARGAPTVSMPACQSAGFKVPIQSLACQLHISACVHADVHGAHFGQTGAWTPLDLSIQFQYGGKAVAKRRCLLSSAFYRAVLCETDAAEPNNRSKV